MKRRAMLSPPSSSYRLRSTTPARILGFLLTSGFLALACSTKTGGEAPLDGNGDGVADDLGRSFDENDDGKPDEFDIDNDGDLDGIGVDTDGDGKPDAIGLDTDDDGIIDAIDKDGDGKPDETTGLEPGGTGGTSGGDGDGDGTGGGVGGTGDGNTGTGTTPDGFENCALTSSITDLGGAIETADRNGPDSHGSLYGAKPRLVPSPRGDGSFDIGWQTENGSDKLYVTHVEESAGNYAAAWHLEVPSLGMIGGLAVSEDGDPIVLTTVDEAIGGDTAPEETHRANIMQVVRIGSDCAEVYREDLRTDFDGDSGRLPLYSPMTAGTARLAVGNGTYVAHFSQNTEYDPGVSQRHQIGRYIVGGSTDGKVTAVQGNISHSFDQRLHFDGTDFLSLSLGDASLRGIGLSLTTPAGNKTQRTLFAIKGGDSNTGGGYNNTFTRLGDVAKSKNGYVSLFSTEANDTHPERVSFSRNLALVHSPMGFDALNQEEKYDVVISDTDSGNDGTVSWDVTINDYWGNGATGKNKNVAWITSYDDRLTAHVERPKLVRWSEDRFFVIWEKWGLDDYEATYAAIVDEWGNVISPATSLGEARLPRGDDAFLINGHAAWLEGAGGNIVLHLLDTELAHTTQTL